MSRVRMRFAVIALLLAGATVFAFIKSLTFAGNATGRVTAVDGDDITVSVTFEGKDAVIYPSGIQKWGLSLGDTLDVACGVGADHTEPLCSPATTSRGFVALGGMFSVLTLACVLLWWPLLARRR